MANLSAKDYQSLCNNIKLDDDQYKKKKGTLIVFLVLMTLLLHSCAISNPCHTTMEVMHLLRWKL